MADQTYTVDGVRIVSREGQRWTHFSGSFHDFVSLTPAWIHNVKDVVPWPNEVEDYPYTNWVGKGPKHHRNPRYWDGHDSVDSIRAVAREGWPEGTARLEELARELSVDIPPAQTIRRRIRRGDDGDDIDIHRVYSGDLDTAWTKRRRALGVGPRTVTLVSLIGVNNQESVDKLFWQGAAGAVLTDVLEAAGYRVKLVSGRSGKDGTWWSLAATVKEYADPMSMDVVAAALCNAAVYRLFMITPINGGKGNHWGQGFGRSEPTKAVERIQRAGELPADAVTIPYASNRSQAVAAIKSVLEQLGKGGENAA